MRKYNLGLTAILAAAVLPLSACGKPDGESTAVSEKGTSASKTDGGASQVDIASLSADPAEVERGRKLYSNCSICHSDSSSKPSPAGPHLEGVVGRDIGSVSDYPYTPALADAGGVWTAEKLTAFLKDPQAAYQGTAMAYAGMAKEEDRQAMIAFLATLDGSSQQ